jgi:hypothetical protein
MANKKSKAAAETSAKIFEDLDNMTGLLPQPFPDAMQHKTVEEFRSQLAAS